MAGNLNKRASSWAIRRWLRNSTAIIRSIFFINLIFLIEGIDTEQNYSDSGKITWKIGKQGYLLVERHDLRSGFGSGSQKKI
jgi:hypothetical protein